MSTDMAQSQWKFDRISLQRLTPNERYRTINQLESRRYGQSRTPLDQSIPQEYALQSRDAFIGHPVLVFRPGGIDDLIKETIEAPCAETTHLVEVVYRPTSQGLESG